MNGMKQVNHLLDGWNEDICNGKSELVRYRAYIERSKYFQEQKRYETAIADLRKASREQPLVVEPHIRLAGIYRATKQFDLALKECDRVVRMSKDKVDVIDSWLDRGFSYVDCQKYDLAIRDFRHIKEFFLAGGKGAGGGGTSDSRYRKAQLQLGLCLLLQNKWDESQQTLTEMYDDHNCDLSMRGLAAYNLAVILEKRLKREGSTSTTTASLRYLDRVHYERAQKLYSEALSTLSGAERETCQIRLQKVTRVLDQIDQKQKHISPKTSLQKTEPLQKNAASLSQIISPLPAQPQTPQPSRRKKRSRSPSQPPPLLAKAMTMSIDPKQRHALLEKRSKQLKQDDWWAASRQAENRDDWETAVRLADEKIRSEPLFTAAYQRKAFALERQSKCQEAIEVYETMPAVTDPVNRGLICIHVSRLYRKMGELEEAYATIQEGLRWNPFHPSAQKEKANLKMELKRLLEAPIAELKPLASASASESESESLLTPLLKSPLLKSPLPPPPPAAKSKSSSPSLGIPSKLSPKSSIKFTGLEPIPLTTNSASLQCETESTSTTTTTTITTTTITAPVSDTSRIPLPLFTTPGITTPVITTPVITTPVTPTSTTAPNSTIPTTIPILEKIRRNPINPPNSTAASMSNNDEIDIDTYINTDISSSTKKLPASSTAPASSTSRNVSEWTTEDVLQYLTRFGKGFAPMIVWVITHKITGKELMKLHEITDIKMAHAELIEQGVANETIRTCLLSAVSAAALLSHSLSSF